MSVSQVEICNIALMKIGSDVIKSLDQDSKNARLCKQFYKSTLEAVLRLHPWNFALKRTRLAQGTETPAFEWDYQYPLPPDCLRVLRLSYDDYEYVIEGRNIVTDESECNLLYVARIEDTTLFDALFINAFSLKLAARMAFPITQSRGIVESLEQEFNLAMMDARTVDAMEDNYRKPPYSEFINARS